MLLTGDKVDRVRAIQRENQRVTVLGDGVDDAPALATADAVLVRNDLAALPATYLSMGHARSGRQVCAGQGVQLVGVVR
ncbi:hypothetical protein AB0M46_34400 [Dactylosporangium sp. NPDC051485]|uniref:hypothetical protein n=1 Tax=Dactylosporangium sp. NPDC051485 TaxID=3154846 RepID=UPI003438814C